MQLMARYTVLMTVYNGMPYLPLAIESILNQTCRDFEFLIINDCSTDGSRDVILSYGDPRIRLIDNAINVGQTASLNTGLEHTRTEIVVRMDADDVSHPTRLEKQAGFLDAHPEVAVVGIHLNQIDAQGRVIGKVIRPASDLQIRWLQLFESSIPGGSAAFRKRVVWDELGGFEPSIRFSQDWELISRIPKRYRLANIPEILYDVRSHAASANSAMLAEVFLDVKRISRDNIRNTLDIEDESPEWLSMIDMLPEGIVWRRVEDPARMLQVVDQFFERYCALHPQAADDPVVLDQLSNQYFRVVEWSHLRSLSTSLRAFRQAKGLTPGKVYFARLLRTLAGLAGGRRIRNWFRRMRVSLAN
jgi:glycosyltransferase involved in cell wall biosynthesis